MAGSDTQIILNPGEGGAGMRVRSIPGLGDQEVVTLADGDGNIFSLPASDSDANNSTAIPNWNPAAVYQGAYTDVSQAGSLFAFILSYEPFDAVNPPVVQWSEDGVTPAMFAGAPVTTALPVQTLLSGGITFYVALVMINAPLIRARFYNIYAKNGATQSPFFYALAGTGRYPATGSLLGLNDPLNSLSTAMLVRSVLAGEVPGGGFGNVNLTATEALSVSLENSPSTPSGSLFVEGVRDDVSIDFSDPASLSLLTANQGSSNAFGGSGVQLDVTNGQVVFDTGTAPGGSFFFQSTFSVSYEPAHGIRGDQTVVLSRLPATSSEYVEWGFGSPTGSAIAYRVDTGGLRIIRRRNGVIEDSAYQNFWNRDICLGQPNSQFVYAGSPQALSVLLGNLYRVQYQWLGQAPIEFDLKSPNDAWVVAHVIEYPNQHVVSSVPQASMPMYIAGFNDATVGGSLQARSGSWQAGLLVSNEQKILPLDTWSIKRVPVPATGAVQLDPVPLPKRKSVTVVNNDPTNAVEIFPRTFSYGQGEVVPAQGSSSMLLSTRGQVWAICQNLGGATTVHDQSPTAASGTGTSPANIEANDASYATAANGQTLIGSSYASPSANPIVNVKIGVKGKKNTSPETETVSFVDVTTATGGNVSTISTPTITADPTLFHVIAISRRNTSAAVSSVTGLGITWTQLDTIANGTNEVIDRWYAVGTGATTGTVTVSMSAPATNVVVALSRYSRVDFTNPITAHSTFTGSTGTVAGSLSGTALGMILVELSANTQTVSSPGAGFTTRNETVTGTGANTVEQAIVTSGIASTGSQPFSITLTGAVAWAACAVTLTPAPTVAPVVTMSYTVSGVAQATSQAVALNSTSDATTLIDVTGDRPWAQSDIPNVAITLTSSVVSASALVNWLYLEITDSTANVVNVTFKEMS